MRSRHVIPTYEGFRAWITDHDPDYHIFTAGCSERNALAQYLAFTFDTDVTLDVLQGVTTVKFPEYKHSFYEDYQIMFPTSWVHIVNAYLVEVVRDLELTADHLGVMLDVVFEPKGDLTITQVV